MNAISFCLFGTDVMYLRGAVRNVELLSEFYPGWRPFFYIGADVPGSVRQELEAKGAFLIKAAENPMISRFRIHDHPSVDRYIVRDCDSRLNARERSAVDAWIKSKLPFHVIRDHPGHATELGGGLWGGMPVAFKMSETIAAWKGNTAAGHRNSIYNNDQIFLREMVWPIIKNRCLQHDFCLSHIYHGTTSFPAHFGDWRFVGEIFDHEDRPNRYGWQQRLNWMVP